MCEVLKLFWLIMKRFIKQLEWSNLYCRYQYINSLKFETQIPCIKIMIAKISPASLKWMRPYYKQEHIKMSYLSDVSTVEMEF